MKRKFIALLIAVSLVFSFTSVFAAEDAIKVVLNGEEIDFADVAPQIINDRTMVPLRAIFEALGAEVTWDDSTKTVHARLGDTEISLPVGKTEFYKNGEAIPLDVPAFIENGRTLIPLRAVADALGCDVDWVGETRTVIITN